MIEKYYKTVRSKLAKSEGWRDTPDIGVSLQPFKLEFNQWQEFYVLTNGPTNNSRLEIAFGEYGLTGDFLFKWLSETNTIQPVIQSRTRITNPSRPDYPGCCRRRRRRQNGEVYFKYEPRVKLNKRRLPLKEYNTWLEAALVHDVAKVCLGIEHGHLNFTLEQYSELPRIPSELPRDEIVEFVLKCAKVIQQQETYQKASSMPPSNLFDPPNPSLMIEDLEFFTESQDVQACDPTNNYLSNSSNQSLIIEGISIFIDLQDGPTCNQNLKDVLCIIWWELNSISK